MHPFPTPDPTTFISKAHEQIYSCCCDLLAQCSEDDYPEEYERYWLSQDDVGKAVMMDWVLKHLNVCLPEEPIYLREDMYEDFAVKVLIGTVMDMKNPRLKFRDREPARKRAQLSRRTNRTMPPKQPIPSPLLEQAIFASALKKRIATIF